MRVGRNCGKIIANRCEGIRYVHPLFTRVDGVSFREFLEYLDFDDKESLLGLNDRNMKQRQEGCTVEGMTQLEHSCEHNAEPTLTRRHCLMETRSWRLNNWFMWINTRHVITF